MRFQLSLLFALLLFNCNAQDKAIAHKNMGEVSINTQPKLVVGIVVDQMRYDYLHHYIYYKIV